MAYLVGTTEAGDRIHIADDPDDIEVEPSGISYCGLSIVYGDFYGLSDLMDWPRTATFDWKGHRLCKHCEVSLSRRESK